MDLSTTNPLLGLPKIRSGFDSSQVNGVKSCHLFMSKVKVERLDDYICTEKQQSMAKMTYKRRVGRQHHQIPNAQSRHATSTSNSKSVCDEKYSHVYRLVTQPSNTSIYLSIIYMYILSYSKGRIFGETPKIWEIIPNPHELLYGKVEKVK